MLRESPNYKNLTQQQFCDVCTNLYQRKISRRRLKEIFDAKDMITAAVSVGDFDPCSTHRQMSQLSRKLNEESYRQQRYRQPIGLENPLSTKSPPNSYPSLYHPRELIYQTPNSSHFSLHQYLTRVEGSVWQS